MQKDFTMPAHARRSAMGTPMRATVSAALDTTIANTALLSGNVSRWGHVSFKFWKKSTHDDGLLRAEGSAPANHWSVTDTVSTLSRQNRRMTMTNKFTVQTMKEFMRVIGKLFAAYPHIQHPEGFHIWRQF